MNVVARSLDRLGAGESYARVSLDALRSVGIDPGAPRRRSPRKEPPERVWDEEAGAFVDPPPGKPRPVSLAAMEGRAAWRIAANWVEAFSPVIWTPIEARLRADALAERARLDAAMKARWERLTADPDDDPGPPDRPQVLVVDDVPVLAREGQTKRRDGGFFVLVVGEMSWERPARIRDGQAEWEPRLSLRLARAMPKSNALAWRIVFDELGYAPDFLVADGGTGIGAAHALHFEGGHTLLVPSLWHIRQTVRGAMRPPGRGAVLAPEIAAHADRLSRSSGVLDDPDTWNDWWEELEGLARSCGVPLDKARNQRRNYQDAVAAVLPHLAVNPGLRLSIGGLEVKIRERIDRVLTLRSQFANVERTNLLLDLVVAREHGAFLHPDRVARLLREDAETRRDGRGVSGFGVSLRTIDDPRPTGGCYSSLRDAGLLASLAEERLAPGDALNEPDTVAPDDDPTGADTVAAA